MMDFLRAGGMGMIFVLLLGGGTLLTAGLFARDPDERRMATLRALSVATVFSVVTAVASNVVAVLWNVPRNPAWAKSPELPLIVMTGLGEALTPAILGGALLTLAWLVASVAMRRLADRLRGVEAALADARG